MPSDIRKNGGFSAEFKLKKFLIEPLCKIFAPFHQKLSQNRDEKNFQRIIENLNLSNFENDKIMAKKMTDLKEKTTNR